MILNINDDIPIEHDIRKWINFLPPLVQIKMRTPMPPSPDFKTRLLDDLKKGSKDQNEKIAVLKSKVIHFSLALQTLIQNVVNKEKPIMTNSVNEPFLENSCCNKLGDVNTIQYFVSQEPGIISYDTEVVELSNIISDIISSQTPCYLYDESNTRIKYPSLPTNFDEKTIYLAFITYCKFNTTLPIPESLQLVCHEKPSKFNSDDSLEERIKQIKNNRIEYTEASLDALLQIINKEHIIPIDLNSNQISYVQSLREILNHFEKSQSNQIPSRLQDMLKIILDTFDMTITEDTSELRDLKNYLGDANITIASEIISFITSNSNLDKNSKTRLEYFINNIMEFQEIGNDIVMNKIDNSTFKAIQFIQTCIDNLVNVFPYMILNNVSFKNITISKHWELPEIHQNDIKNIVEKH